ncbi:autotransporter outer membrane beta-barrel domain-containing protein [Hoeflea sp.]|uniref:autotransporter outer membrane beta-barrel domain-containing protein n=1 Tax=Hoeflea sp. TaxID=1940281 RepID=UPI0019C460E4|nr:autotransporter outer membrane beta-barrel domain-containing protein [Hoeflea sp.]MBC7283266.1 autotransporter outer membrane beta-barrel domain-containing protein [Hoeflea sp.]
MTTLRIIIDRTAEASCWTHLLGLSGELAYRIETGPATTIAPLTTLDAAWSGHGSFTETGAGALDLTGASEDWTRFDTGLGASFAPTMATETGPVTLEGPAVWEHAFEDVVPDQALSFAGSPTGFTVRGPDARRDRLRPGAGLSFAATYTLALHARPARPLRRRVLQPPVKPRRVRRHPS